MPRHQNWHGKWQTALPVRTEIPMAHTTPTPTTPFGSRAEELAHGAETLIQHDHRLGGTAVNQMRKMADELCAQQAELERLRSRDRENQARRLATLVRTHIPARQMPYQVYAIVNVILED